MDSLLESLLSMTTSTQFQASEKEDKETVQFVFFFDIVCFLMQAVQPESSRVQPPVPTPVRADATLPVQILS